MTMHDTQLVTLYRSDHAQQALNLLNKGMRSQSHTFEHELAVLVDWNQKRGESYASQAAATYSLGVALTLGLLGVAILLGLVAASLISR